MIMCDMTGHSDEKLKIAIYENLRVAAIFMPSCITLVKGAQHFVQLPCQMNLL